MTDSSAAADLVAMLGALTDPHKAGKVDTRTKAGVPLKYTFLTLPALLAEVRTKAADHNLALMQPVSTLDTGHTAVETVLIHTSGERFTSGLWVMPEAHNPQATGSQLSFWRRYQLATFVGLAGSDDDDAAQVPDYAQTRPVTRHQQAETDPDEYREPPPITGGAPAISEFSGRMPASQSQHGAIRGIAGMLGVGTGDDLVKAFVHWLLRRDAPDRPDDLLMSKAEASHILNVIGVKAEGSPWAVSDAGKALAQEYLGAML